MHLFFIIHLIFKGHVPDQGYSLVLVSNENFQSAELDLIPDWEIKLMSVEEKTTHVKQMKTGLWNHIAFACGKKHLGIQVCLAMKTLD